MDCPRRTVSIKGGVNGRQLSRVKNRADLKVTFLTLIALDLVEFS
jgi:hypothetical protein